MKNLFKWLSQVFCNHSPIRYYQLTVRRPHGNWEKQHFYECSKCGKRLPKLTELEEIPPRA